MTTPITVPSLMVNIISDSSHDNETHSFQMSRGKVVSSFTNASQSNLKITGEFVGVVLPSWVDLYIYTHTLERDISTSVTR